MTIEEAIEIINGITPCASCQYRNTGCKRKNKHVWSDGLCHKFDEAIALIIETLGIDPYEDEDPYEPVDGNEEPNNGQEGNEPYEPESNDNENEGDEEP